MSVRRKTIERELATLKQRYAGDFDAALLEISRTGGSPLSYACLFSWCCQSKPSLAQLQQAHHLAARQDHLHHAFVGNMLLQAYRLHAQPLLAKAAFSTLPSKDVFTWTIMVAAYAQKGHTMDAAHVFRSMELHGVKPSNVTYVTLLSAVSSREFVNLGKMIHGRVRGSADVILGTALISMYGRCGSVDEAGEVFESMPERNLITWTALITAFAQHGRETQAVELYQKLHGQGMSPDAVTFISVLDACTSLGDVKLGRKLHSSIPEHLLQSNTPLRNALINMYGKCGAVDEARLVFETSRERSLSTWNCLLTGYAKQGLAREAVELYNTEMDVKPDHVTYLSLVSACMQLGDVSAGSELHKRIQEEREPVRNNEALCHALMNMFTGFGKPDKVRDIFTGMDNNRNVISWTCVVAGYAHNGRTEETRFMFRCMRLEGVDPDGIAFVTLLFSCSHGGLVEPCVEVYRCMVEEYGVRPRVEHLTCVVDVLARSGKVEEAEEFIMACECTSGVLWNTLLSSCKTHRDVERGRRAAERVLEVEPDNWPAYVLLSNMYAEGEGENEQTSKARERVSRLQRRE